MRVGDRLPAKRSPICSRALGMMPCLVRPTSRGRACFTRTHTHGRLLQCQRQAWARFTTQVWCSIGIRDHLQRWRGALAQDISPVLRASID